MSHFNWYTLLLPVSPFKTCTVLALLLLHCDIYTPPTCHSLLKISFTIVNNTSQMHERFFSTHTVLVVDKCLWFPRPFIEGCISKLSRLSRLFTGLLWDPAPLLRPSPGEGNAMGPPVWGGRPRSAPRGRGLRLPGSGRVRGARGQRGADVRRNAIFQFSPHWKRRFWILFESYLHLCYLSALGLRNY